MNSKSLTKQYGKFTLEERFRLIMAAKYRGDLDDIEHLIDTNYGRELGLFDCRMFARAKAVEDIANAFCFNWLQFKQLEERFRSIPIEDIAGLLDFMADEEPEKCLQSIKGFVNSFIGVQSAKSILKGLYLGFLEFCQNVSISPEHILSHCMFWDLMRNEVEEVKQGESQADESTQVQAKKAYLGIWHKWTGTMGKNHGYSDNRWSEWMD